jgi:hypothetical protein
VAGIAVSLVCDFVEHKGEVFVEASVDTSQVACFEGGETPPADKMAAEGDAIPHSQI